MSVFLPTGKKNVKQFLKKAEFYGMLLMLHQLYNMGEVFTNSFFFKSCMYFYLHLVKIQAYLSFLILLLKKILYDWCSDKSELCIFRCGKLRFAALFIYERRILIGQSLLFESGERENPYRGILLLYKSVSQRMEMFFIRRRSTLLLWYAISRFV